MCGRFTLATPAEALVELLGLAEAPVVPPRYNIAPGQPVAAAGRRGPGQPTRLSLLHWGFEREGGGLLINARAETAHRLPAFREAFRARRCLVPADGFYEWQRRERGKQPFHVRRADGRPFAFAALWQPRPGREPAAACVLLTTTPNELVAPIHDRMPPHGPIVCVPYSNDVNDFNLFARGGMSGANGLETLKACFDQLYMESAQTGRIMNFGMHPHVMGQPHRLGALREFIEYAASHSGVWFASPKKSPRGICKTTRSTFLAGNEWGSF